MVHDTNVGKKTLQMVLRMVHDTNVGKKTLQRVLGMVHDTNVGKKLCRGYWECYYNSIPSTLCKVFSQHLYHVPTLLKEVLY